MSENQHNTPSVWSKCINLQIKCNHITGIVFAFFCSSDLLGCVHVCVHMLVMWERRVPKIIKSDKVEIFVFCFVFSNGRGHQM